MGQECKIRVGELSPECEMEKMEELWNYTPLTQYMASLNCNAPKHLFCFSLGSEVFMKCQDEHASLSPLSSTGKIWGISHLEQPAKLAVLSIIQNGRRFVFFSVDFERILMGQHKVKMCCCFFVQGKQGKKAKPSLYFHHAKHHCCSLDCSSITSVYFFSVALKSFSLTISLKLSSMVHLKLIIPLFLQLKALIHRACFFCAVNSHASIFFPPLFLSWALSHSRWTFHGKTARHFFFLSFAARTK